VVAFACAEVRGAVCRKATRDGSRARWNPVWPDLVVDGEGRRAAVSASDRLATDMTPMARVVQRCCDNVETSMTAARSRAVVAAHAITRMRGSSALTVPSAVSHG
jgi:hypothetical protein